MARLQVRSSRLLSGGAAAFALCALLWGSRAAADPVVLPQDVIVADGRITWEEVDSSTSDGFIIDDASFNNLSDAYDDAFALTVNGTRIDVSTSADRSEVNFGTLYATTITGMDTNAPDGLDITIEYAFYDRLIDGTGGVRVRYIISNPGAMDVAVNALVVTNLGSDSDTQIEFTSSGDDMLTTDDRWAITSDMAPFDNDPLVVMAFHGPGAPAVTPMANTLMSDDYETTYSFTVPAGQTRTIMMFSFIALNFEDAVQAAINLDTNESVTASGLICDLSADALGQIANWDALTAGGCPTLTGRVFNDLNSNGLQDAEEPGVPGIRVVLLNSEDESEVTDRESSTNGDYDFGRLITGSYQLEIDVPPVAGVVLTTQDAGDDTLDSDADPATARTEVFETTIENLDFDFGLVAPQLSDDDDDGVPDEFDLCDGADDTADSDGDGLSDCLEDIIQDAIDDLGGGGICGVCGAGVGMFAPIAGIGAWLLGGAMIARRRRR